MNTFMLAEMASKMDFGGVFCLASLVFLFIALLAYSTGVYSGSCMCVTFFVIAVFATGDTSESEGLLSHSANKAYIANRSQTKIIEIAKYSINDPDCSFMINSDGLQRFIPAEERVIIDGYYRMKATGKEAHMYNIAPATQLEERDWSKPNGWMYGEKYGNWGLADDYLYLKDGVMVKVNTGKPPTDDDYYIHNETYAPINVAVEHGGSGLPQWVYHPASPCYIFGIGALPCFLAIGYIKKLI